MSRADYTGLDDEQVMALAQSLTSRSRPQQLHDYIETVRGLVDGADTVTIPQSHRALGVGENHEAGHRLNVRIRQGAAWYASATMRFSVTPGSSKFREQAEQMERFARFGEQRLARGTALHRWKREAARDLFECGVSVVQHHPHRGFYIEAQRDRTLMTKGARIEEIFWRRRVDPLYWYWDEDVDGRMGASMVAGRRSLTEVARVIDEDRYRAVRSSFAWAESLPDSRFTTDGTSVDVRELWLPDRGVLIYNGESTEGKGSQMAAGDPRRVIASWRNTAGKVPFYVTTASPWPWHSPLDEMVALSGERNFWATMLDLQAAGAIFRHWQLKDTNTGEDIARAIWTQSVPEHVLLDLSKPPPFMGPGTEWTLAPFEFFDVNPRYQMIALQHESAGSSVSRLMGHDINANTAVGTADMTEDYARREFADLLESGEDAVAEMWEDSFAYIAKQHKREPLVVAGRIYDKDEGEFFQTHLELRGSDIVAEDISVRFDMRSLLSLIGAYRLGREMQNNGDISYERRVEQGLVPYVDDAEAEVADIFISQIEKITLEQEAMSHAQSVAQNLGSVQQAAPPPAPANITRSAQADPRGTGTQRGPLNASDTALATGATDTVRSA